MRTAISILAVVLAIGFYAMLFGLMNEFFNGVIEVWEHITKNHNK